MTTTVLIILNVIAAISIIALALMQQSKGDMGAAFGGGGSQSMFGSRGSANFLSRLTSIMVIVFFISSLTLAYIYSKRGEESDVLQGSVIKQTKQEAVIEQENSDIPAIPGAAPVIVESELPEQPEAAKEAEATVPAVPNQ